MSTKHIPSLDGLRGMAILPVLLVHYIYLPQAGLLFKICGKGWVGVDLFFVISGFLITGILYDTQHSEDFYRNFYIRRALRLFPAYFVLIAITLVLAHGFGERSWKMALPYLLYGSNIVLFFDPKFKSIGPVHLLHLWSLAVEEQFYLIWPWIVTLLSTRQRILKACLFGSLGALVLRLILSPLPLPEMTLYTEFPTRVDSLLIGAAIAMLVRDEEFMSKLRMRYVALICGASFAAFFAMGTLAHSFAFTKAPINTWGFSMLGLSFGSLLLLTITEGTLANRIFSSPFLRFYGKYSYGIYLFHLPPLQLYTKLLWFMIKRVHSVMLGSAIACLIAIPIATGIAVLSFHLIEKPFLWLKKYFEGNRIARREMEMVERSVSMPLIPDSISPLPENTTK